MENIELDGSFLSQQLNDVIGDWGRQSKQQYLFELRRLPFKARTRTAGRGDILRGRVGVNFRMQYGDITRVAWKFTKHGIMQEHGVGRGRKLGSGKEKPMPWIKPTLELQVPKLADALQDEAVKLLAPIIRIKVNGIFDVELKA